MPSYVCCTLYTSSRMDDTMCADVVGPCTGENDYIRFVWMKLRKSANGKHVERMKCCRVVIAVTYVNRSRLSHRTCNNRRHTEIDAHKMFNAQISNANYSVSRLFRSSTDVCFIRRAQTENLHPFHVRQSKKFTWKFIDELPIQFNFIDHTLLPYNYSEWLTLALQIMIDIDKRLQNYRCTVRRCFASLVLDIYIIPSLQMPLEWLSE